MMRRLVLVAALLCATACSVLLESSPSQCSTDGDCQSRGGEFAGAVCTDGRCALGAANLPCATNVECTERLAAPAICRSRDHRCAALLSPECTHVFGDVTNDDTIVFGTIFATTGTNGPSGLARQTSAELALDEIRASVGGIRSGVDGRPRPLAIVECDDALESVKSATHLVDDVGVQAIVGIAASSRVTEVVTSVTIPKGVLVLTPSATSPTLTSLPDANLVWRTAPSDALQSVALIDQFSALEKKYRADNAVPAATKLRVSFLYIDESYGLGLYEAVTRAAVLNGKPIGDAANVGLSAARTYPQKPNPDLTQQVAAALAENPRPSIIVAFGSTEVITKFIAPLEKQWGTSAPRPVYLLADAAQKTELLDLVATDDSLRQRVRGSIPAPPRSSSNFKSFVFKYEGRYGAPAPSTFGMAGTYDAMFLLAYSVAAAGPRPITGDELQKGFARLVKGAPIDVGGTNMNTGFQALASPGTFDFDGASGPLDFDLATGEARSNIDVWCIAKDANGRPIFVPSLRFFDAKSNAMSGTYDLAACAAK
jgi:branched-chain amino acid transport system substrate-binding protein